VAGIAVPSPGAAMPVCMVHCSHYEYRVTSRSKMARYTPAATRRRKPNPAERRRDLCDAAIQLLADDGAKGLSHLKVDRKADVPDGTTSFYFRTRTALLRAVAERLAELDLETLQSVADSGDRRPANPSPSLLSQVVIQAGSEPQLTRTRARHELTMNAARDPALAAILQRATEAFTKLHQEILVQLMPHGAELDSAVVEDLSNVTLTFINGLLLRFAQGDRVVDTPEQLDGILSAIAAGVLRSPHKGRLTNGDEPRLARRLDTG
jgi:DNA-binding transcriptional regulator YbjK